MYTDWSYQDSITCTVLFDYKLYRFDYQWTLSIYWENLTLCAYTAELLAMIMWFKLIQKYKLKNITIFTDNISLWWVLNWYFATKNVVMAKLLEYFKTVKNQFNVNIEKVSSKNNLADLKNTTFLMLKNEYHLDKDFFKNTNVNFIDISLQDFYQAYYKAKKWKNKRKDFLEIEMNLYEELNNLYKSVINKTYLISPYKCFVSNKRKYREIFMLWAKENIIQHFIIQKIWYLFEKSFIYDVWDHRLWKWIHKAHKRLRKFIRSCTNNYDFDGYFLKTDIKSFFYTVDRWILRKILFKKVKNEHLRYLLDQFLLLDVTKHFEFTNWTTWEDIQKLSKSLFKVKKWKWLPLGNVLSQFFSLVYLNELDQFVKHKLKIRYYLRYADDMVILAKNKKQLFYWKNEIKKFLKENLSLSLSKEKTYIWEIKNWIKWLGKIFFLYDKEKLLNYHYDNFEKNGTINK